MNTTAARPGVSRLTKGYIICLVGTTIWSLTAVLIGYLSRTYQLPPLVLAFWRDLFAAATLAAVLAALFPSLLRVERRHLGFLLLYGFVLSIFNALWTVSVSLNGAAVATVLVYSSPALTAILSWRFFGERLDAVKGLAVMMSIAGCVLVAGAYDPAAWRVNTLGIATGLLAGIAFAAYNLLGKASSERGMNSWTTLMYIFGLAAGFLLAYNAISGGAGNLMWLGSAAAGWGVLVALAVGPTIGGYGLYTFSLGYLPATVANLIVTLEPSMTAALAYVFLGDRMAPVQLLGGLVIIAAVVILRLSEWRPAR